MVLAGPVSLDGQMDPRSIALVEFCRLGGRADSLEAVCSYASFAAGASGTERPRRFCLPPPGHHSGDDSDSIVRAFGFGANHCGNHSDLQRFRVGSLPPGHTSEPYRTNENLPHLRLNNRLPASLHLRR